MRIAFDVDETLIPYGDEFPTERSVPFGLLSFWYRERLRLGTTALLRELARDGHDVWIYTTSGRTSGYFRMWFLWLGIRLGGVINCHTHEQVIRAPGRSYPHCSKYPPAWNIDLLVDNSDGVALEGRRHGFDVLVVATDDLNWTERVRDAVRARHRLVPKLGK